MNAHDFKARLFIRMWHFDTPINSAGANESLIKNVKSVRGHHDLDVGGRFETIELIQKLQHCALHFTITTARATVTSRRADGINLKISSVRSLACKHLRLANLIHEDDRRGVLARHDEKLSNHSASFTNVFLHELATGNSYEAAVGMVRNCARKQRFTRARGTIQ